MAKVCSLEFQRQKVWMKRDKEKYRMAVKLKKGDVIDLNEVGLIFCTGVVEYKQKQ